MSEPGNDPKEPADLLKDGGSSSTPNEFGGTHEVIYDRERGQHISWDTYKDGTYVPGSGHTRDDNSGKTISRWDD
ncbi:MAG: hypothetical protein KatS3mg088_689 [Patescibacteria group bacterium]|nr:MAG: hypothetical protein KatS3mg088_689 [Patescibacteria group bacterium]